MKVSELLKAKKLPTFKTTPETPIREALKYMLDNQIGSLMVCAAGNPNQVEGIISERDILRAIYQDCEAVKSQQVKDLMSRDLITATPDDELDHIMELMTENRIRHLPIVDQQGIAGVVSMRDIVYFQLREAQTKNRYLEEYMYPKQ